MAESRRGFYLPSRNCFLLQSSNVKASPTKTPWHDAAHPALPARGGNLSSLANGEHGGLGKRSAAGLAPCHSSRSLKAAALPAASGFAPPGFILFYFWFFPCCLLRWGVGGCMGASCLPTDPLHNHSRQLTSACSCSSKANIPKFSVGGTCQAGLRQRESHFVLSGL